MFIEAGGDSAVITGDVIHHTCQIAYPDLRNVAESIADKAQATRRAFIRDFADTSTLVLGSHFSQPTCGRIVSWNGQYKFDVANIASVDTGIE